MRTQFDVVILSGYFVHRLNEFTNFECEEQFVDGQESIDSTSSCNVCSVFSHNLCQLISHVGQYFHQKLLNHTFTCIYILMWTSQWLSIKKGTVYLYTMSKPLFNEEDELVFMNRCIYIKHYQLEWIKLENLPQKWSGWARSHTETRGWHAKRAGVSPG